MQKEANYLSVCQTFQVLTRSCSRTLAELEGEPGMYLNSVIDSHPKISHKQKTLREVEDKKGYSIN